MKKKNSTKIKSEFQPIFDYIDETKKEIISEILSQTASKGDVNNLRTSLDGYAKQTKDYYQEVTVVVAKVNRIEAWIQKAAHKVGLEYEV